jgi:hypothetical protein
MCVHDIRLMNLMTEAARCLTEAEQLMRGDSAQDRRCAGALIERSENLKALRLFREIDDRLAVEQQDKKKQQQLAQQQAMERQAREIEFNRAHAAYNSRRANPVSAEEFLQIHQQIEQRRPTAPTKSKPRKKPEVVAKQQVVQQCRTC